MAGPLFGIDPRKGMFKRYELPLHMLSTFPPIFGNDSLAELASEAFRRLRQLDRFYEESWACVHRAVAPQVVAELPEAAMKEAFDVVRGAIDGASDAAEAFYLFGFRVFDITRIMAKKACGEDLQIPQPKNFMAVRNHLLVHPERYPGNVLSWSVYVTNKDSRGVVIKHERRAAEKNGREDPGLGPNALELQSYIENWIITLHAKLQEAEAVLHLKAPPTVP